MPKRRERDRPKNAPGSLYNPNKRVLLSYASDNEDEEQQVQPQQFIPPPYQGATATEPMEVPEKEQLNGNAPPNPAAKRSEQGEEDIENEQHLEDVAQYGPSRQASDFRTSQRTLRKNDVTGQWTALGSWSYQWEDGYDEDQYDEVDGEFDSTEEEAMAYLRAVRSERQHIPDILAVSQTPHDEDDIYALGSHDTRGYIDDGAYVVRGSMGPELPDHLKTTINPQEAFTTSLKTRFLAHRCLLHTHPSPGAVETLSDQHPISFPHSNNRAYADWHRFILKVPPLPAQLQAMAQNTLANILELVQCHFLVREKQINTTTAAWIWAMLARLDGVETMDNDRVWTLREFAKKAVLVQLSFDDPESAAELERLANQGREVPQSTTPRQVVKCGEASTDETADKPKDSTEDAERAKVRQNTLAILDTILVVVGDVFGQRDLLEFRRPWTRVDER